MHGSISTTSTHPQGTISTSTTQTGTTTSNNSHETVSISTDTKCTKTNTTLHATVSAFTTQTGTVASTLYISAWNCFNSAHLNPSLLKLQKYDWVN